MWNPSTCEIDNYLESYAYMKILIDDSLVTCDEIIDKPEIVNKL